MSEVHSNYTSFILCW